MDQIEKKLIYHKFGLNNKIKTNKNCAIGSRKKFKIKIRTKLKKIIYHQ